MEQQGILRGSKGSLIPWSKQFSGFRKSLKMTRYTRLLHPQGCVLCICIMYVCAYDMCMYTYICSKDCWDKLRQTEPQERFRPPEKPGRNRGQPSFLEEAEKSKLLNCLEEALNTLAKTLSTVWAAWRLFSTLQYLAFTSCHPRWDRLYMCTSEWGFVHYL